MPPIRLMGICVAFGVCHSLAEQSPQIPSRYVLLCAEWAPVHLCGDATGRCAGRERRGTPYAARRRPRHNAG